MEINRVTSSIHSLTQYLLETGNEGKSCCSYMATSTQSECNDVLECYDCNATNSFKCTKLNDTRSTVKSTYFCLRVINMATALFWTLPIASLLTKRYTEDRNY